MFSEDQLEALRSFPDIGRDDLIRFFTLTPADVAFVDPGRGRGPADRLGLAVQLSTLPWLGFGLSVRLVPGSTNRGFPAGQGGVGGTGNWSWSGSLEKCRVGFWYRHSVGFRCWGLPVGAGPVAGSGAGDAATDRTRHFRSVCVRPSLKLAEETAPWLEPSMKTS
jgi:hypothetical protein